jgi:hypothetical protein
MRNNLKFFIMLPTSKIEEEPPHMPPRPLLTYDSMFRWMIGYALLMVLIYPIGIPLTYAILVFRNRGDIDPILPPKRSEEAKKILKDHNTVLKNIETLQREQKYLQEERTKLKEKQKNEAQRETKEDTAKRVCYCCNWLANRTSAKVAAASSSEEGAPKVSEAEVSKGRFEHAGEENENNLEKGNHCLEAAAENEGNMGKIEDIEEQLKKVEEQLKKVTKEVVLRRRGERPSDACWAFQKARMKEPRTGPEAVEEARLIRQHNRDLIFIQFLFDSYLPRVWWYEVYECIRRLLQ